MKVIFHKRLTKSYDKCERKARLQVQEQLRRFRDDPLDPRLNNHRLHGKLKNLHSINVTGDLRALYRIINEDTVEFVLIDTHNNLYG